MYWGVHKWMREDFPDMILLDKKQHNAKKEKVNYGPLRSDQPPWRVQAQMLKWLISRRLGERQLDFSIFCWLLQGRPVSPACTLILTLQLSNGMPTGCFYYLHTYIQPVGCKTTAKCKWTTVFAKELSANWAKTLCKSCLTKKQHWTKFRTLLEGRQFEFVGEEGLLKHWNIMCTRGYSNSQLK